MARPVSSKLSVPNVLCSDGAYRTFRYYSKTSMRGTVRVDGTNVTGDIRHSKYGGAYFHADPTGMNYYLMPNEQLTETLWNELVSICARAKALGLNDVDPMYIARFVGLEVNEEEGWVKAPTPIPYNELELGAPPTD